MSLLVLVVEDSRTQAIRLRADLESQAFRVATAANGLEALSRARREPPDVILADVLMPEMDGFRLCREAQTDPALRDIPIVLRSSAFVSDEDRRFALSLGAREYINKELERAELAALLRRVVDEALPDGTSVATEEFHGVYQERLLTRLVEEASHLEKANEELRESRARLQAILDHSPTAIYAKDLEGRYLLANRYFEVFGLDPGSMIGRTDLEIFDAESASGFRASDLDVIEQGTAVHREDTLTIQGSEYRFLSARFPILDAEGELTAVAGVALDITERSRMEERLRQAERMEALGRLSSGVAHDFNNLLTIISNYAAFIAEDLPQDDHRSEDLAQVQDAATRGASLVRQLLTFGARKDLGDAVEAELNTMISGMEALLRASAGGLIQLELDLGTDIPPIMVEPAKLDQIILNLVTNARDAMPKGGSLKIRTSLESIHAPRDIGDSRLPPGSYAVLTVADTGTGMDEETLHKLFEPFFTKNKPGKGTGLGLATVHGIIRGAGGSISVRSEMGKGTTFEIWLPAAGAMQPSGAVDRPRLGGPLPATPTVLVVDDERAIRNLVRRMLESSGYEVVTAASAEQALAIFEDRQEEIDLVLTDVRMDGGMSGLGLAERLRALAPSLPVLHMSGSDASSEVRALRKPFTKQDLLEHIEHRLESGAVAALER